MTWKVTTMSESRFALCHAVRSLHVPVARAARQFGVSRQTAHKWLRVFDADPSAPASALADRPRRPHRSPGKTADAVEARVLKVRDERNWGPRKIRHFLAQEAERRGEPPPDLPSVRTCAAILARNGRVGAAGRPGPAPELQRFERGRPNELWQVDFKGPVEVARRDVCPLAVIDDHSRYLLAFRPCTDKTMATAWAVLWDVFAEAGLPEQVLADNGFKAQEGLGSGVGAPGLGWFDARLIRLGITPAHGRPYHPQTQGKVERLNGSSVRELIGFDARLDALDHFTLDCERWRGAYNALRPHEALGDRPPLSRWRPSDCPRPAELPDPQAFYPAGATLRRVSSSGDVRFNGYRILCGRGITGHLVRVEDRDRELLVFYCWKRIRTLSHEQLRTGIML